MPVDKWRNIGPEDSEDYHPYLKTKSNNEITWSRLKNGERKDGRKIDEPRKIYMKAGSVTSVKGSAYIEADNTKILVSVHEPREIPRLTEFCANGELAVEFRFAPFSGQSRRSPQVQRDEKELGQMLRRALEPAVVRSQFPNCQVNIYVLVLDDDGSCFAQAVTAAGVALVNAGIPMFDSIGCVTMGFHNDQLFLDPDRDEENFCLQPSEADVQGLVTLAYLPSIGQISCYHQVGALKPQQLLDSQNLLVERCLEITEVSKAVIVKDVRESLETKEK